MYLFDATSREPTETRDAEDIPATVTSIVNEVREPSSPTSLARGIVWADILADIAADEEARYLRDAA